MITAGASTRTVNPLSAIRVTPDTGVTGVGAGRPPAAVRAPGPQRPVRVHRERVVPAGRDLSSVLRAPVHDDRGGAVRRGGAVAELPEVVQAPRPHRARAPRQREVEARADLGYPVPGEVAGRGGPVGPGPVAELPVVVGPPGPHLAVGPQRDDKVLPGRDLLDAGKPGYLTRAPIPRAAVSGLDRSQAPAPASASRRPVIRCHPRHGAFALGIGG
jgi:hypothetical protein